MNNSNQIFIMKLLSPLTYPQKFVFISCFFAFSIIVSGYFMISAQNSYINFVKEELKGVLYEKPMRKLMENIPKYYLATRSKAQGYSSNKIEIISLEGQIKSDFKSLEIFARDKDNAVVVNGINSNGKESAASQINELERKWSDLVKLPSEARQETRNTLFNTLLEDLKELMINVGDATNLTVDPEITTGYLIQILLFQLPQTQYLFPKATLALEYATHSKNLTTAERDSLIEIITLLQLSVHQTKISLEKVFNGEKNNKSDGDTQNKLKDPFRQYLSHAEEFIEILEKIVAQGKDTSINWFEITTLTNKAAQTGFNFWDTVNSQLEHLLEDRLAKFNIQQHFSILIVIIVGIVGFMIGFLIMRNISHPLSDLIQAAKKLSDGVLSARVPVKFKDEVGQVGEAFNQMADSFQELIGQLQWTGIQLTTSTTEIAATAKQQETTIVEQEATTKEIAATAREISNTAKDFAKTMNDVNNTAEQTSALAASGKAGLQRMEAVMRQMVDAAGNIASKLAVLNEKASSITSIITTIAKVADQTNLLSLNAAIEAEKAGEYGRSFAVIAREIRRLADQTANATLDIEKMVNEMVSAVSAGVMGVDKFSEEINTGVKQVSVVGEHLSKIIEQVQQQTSSFEVVNQGMQAQSLGAEQINDAINQLSEAAQQTTESIRQFHTAIEQLNNAAQEMQNAVSKIKR